MKAENDGSEAHEPDDEVVEVFRVGQQRVRDEACPGTVDLVNPGLLCRCCCDSGSLGLDSLNRCELLLLLALHHWIVKLVLVAFKFNILHQAEDTSRWLVRFFTLSNS